MKSVKGSANAYIPVAPFTASYATVLSQDVILSDDIISDAMSPAPVATFVSPLPGPGGAAVVEALVVSGGTLGHARRDTSTDAGWSLGAPVASGGTAVAAREVCAGTPYVAAQYNTVYGLYQDEDGLNAIQLGTDGVTWSAPVTVTSGLLTNLRSVYSPMGALVVSALDSSGALVLAYQPNPGEAFVVQRYTMPPTLGAGTYALCFSDEASWMLAAEIGGALWMFTGTLGDGSSIPNSGGQASNYSGTVSTMLLGYWSGMQQAMMFLFVDGSGTLQCWTTAGGASSPAPTPNGAITTAAAHVYVDPDTGNDSLHVYAVDSNQTLSVLHQDLANPWTSDGMPVWAAYIPLDTGIATVHGDTNPADRPALFALSGGDSALHLYRQDPLTKMWRTGRVQQSGTTATEVTRFRAEVVLTDKAGVPLIGQQVSVGVAPNGSTVDLWANGAITPITSQCPATLTSDATGKVTLAVMTTGLDAPTLTLTADGLTGSQQIFMGLATHTYLSGNGGLNPTNPPNPAKGAGPLQPFDAAGKTLAGATVNGRTLAPGASDAGLAGVAASAIQQTAMVGLGTTSTGVAGFSATLSGGPPSFSILSSAEEVRAHADRMSGGPLRSGVGGFWSDIGDFFEDLWQAIKSGVIALKNFVVDVAEQTVSLAVQIGDDIVQGVKIALQGMEQAAHFIAGVFSAVEAAIEDLVDWLKALFDFAAIWRTKQVFETSLLQIPAYIQGLSGLAAKTSQGWFSAQEALVHQAFQAQISRFGGQNFGNQPGFQPAGSPPDAGTPVAGGATPADFGNNPHHNWLQNKVSSYGSDSLGLSADSSLSDPWTDFCNNVQGALSDFTAALKTFSAAITATIEDPSSFGTVAIPDFLAALDDLTEGLLKFLDAIIDGLLAIADKVMASLSTLLTTALDAPVLQALWTWLADSVGASDTTLDVAGFMALLAAFPTTVIYKLIAGVDEEPFPAASSGALEATGARRLGGAMPPGAILASSILQTVYLIPAVASDVLTPNVPTWLTLATLGANGAVWATRSGLPPLDEVEWESAAVIAANLLWIAPSIYFVMQSVAPTTLSSIQSTVLSNDVTSGVSSVYGLVMLALNGVVDMNATPETMPDGRQIAASLMLPLPTVMSLVNMSFFREDPGFAPYAIAAKVGFDLVGYLGGGIALTVDAAEALSSGAAVGSAA